MPDVKSAETNWQYGVSIDLFYANTFQGDEKIHWRIKALDDGATVSCRI